MILMRNDYGRIAHKPYRKWSIFGNSFFAEERAAEVERIAVDLIAYYIEGLE